MNSSEKINKGAILMAEGFAEILNDICAGLNNAFANLAAEIRDVVSNINFDKKLTKKKFCKLLQSYGIQRNEINKIVANNKEPYTYKRLYSTLNTYKKG